MRSFARCLVALVAFFVVGIYLTAVALPPPPVGGGGPMPVCTDWEHTSHDLPLMNEPHWHKVEAKFAWGGDYTATNPSTNTISVFPNNYMVVVRTESSDVNLEDFTATGSSSSTASAGEINITNATCIGNEIDYWSHWCHFLPYNEELESDFVSSIHSYVGLHSGTQQAIWNQEFLPLESAQNGCMIEWNGRAGSWSGGGVRKWQTVWNDQFESRVRLLGIEWRAIAEDLGGSGWTITAKYGPDDSTAYDVSIPSPPTETEVVIHGGPNSEGAQWKTIMIEMSKEHATAQGKFYVRVFLNDDDGTPQCYTPAVLLDPTLY